MSMSMSPKCALTLLLAASPRRGIALRPDEIRLCASKHDVFTRFDLDRGRCARLRLRTQVGGVSALSVSPVRVPSGSAVKQLYSRVLSGHMPCHVWSVEGTGSDASAVGPSRPLVGTRGARRIQRGHSHLLACTYTVPACPAIDVRRCAPDVSTFVY